MGAGGFPLPREGSKLEGLDGRSAGVWRYRWLSMRAGFPWPSWGVHLGNEALWASTCGFLRAGWGLPPTRRTVRCRETGWSVCRWMGCGGSDCGLAVAVCCQGSRQQGRQLYGLQVDGGLWASARPRRPLAESGLACTQLGWRWAEVRGTLSWM